MELSLAEAARLLGKSERQVRYLIKTGTLPAKKRDGRWRIQREDLPLSKGQQRAARQKAERAARLAVEVLQPREESKTPARRYSVRELKAYQEAAPLCQELTQEVGSDHPAVPLLRESLMLLACGCHEYDGQRKARFYVSAREQASRAAMTLLLEEGRPEWVDRFETALLPAIGGLIRQAERRGRKR